MTPCAACRTLFNCRADDITACGCYTIILPEAAKKWIAQQYNGCLCTGCLLRIKKEFEGKPD